MECRGKYLCGFHWREFKKCIPKVESFAASNQVAEICEPGNIGVLYDCANRIPLASSAVLTCKEYFSKSYRATNHFRQSAFIGKSFQQHDTDYEQSLKRVPCYKASNSKYYTEHNWWRSITKASISPYSRKRLKMICKNKISIHRGHLVAPQYDISSFDSFVFTNAIPQFGIVNSGSWNYHETALKLWAR